MFSPDKLKRPNGDETFTTKISQDRLGARESLAKPFERRIYGKDTQINALPSALVSLNFLSAKTSAQIPGDNIFKSIFYYCVAGGSSLFGVYCLAIGSFLTYGAAMMMMGTAGVTFGPALLALCGIAIIGCSLCILFMGIKKLLKKDYKGVAFLDR